MVSSLTKMAGRATLPLTTKSSSMALHKLDSYMMLGSRSVSTSLWLSAALQCSIGVPAVTTIISTSHRLPIVASLSIFKRLYIMARVAQPAPHLLQALLLLRRQYHRALERSLYNDVTCRISVRSFRHLEFNASASEKPSMLQACISLYMHNNFGIRKAGRVGKVSKVRSRVELLE